jgi:hypothetical protein
MISSSPKFSLSMSENTVPPSFNTQSVTTSPGKGAHKWEGKIFIEQNLIKDQFGRTLSLRGVNLTGHSKLPTGPANATHHGRPEFFDHRNVTFVGRPFSSEHAHEHFERLGRWGLTFCRMLVPWEALGNE